MRNVLMQTLYNSRIGNNTYKINAKTVQFKCCINISNKYATTLFFNYSDLFTILEILIFRTYKQWIINNLHQLKKAYLHIQH